MASLNSVSIIGRMGKNPELRRTQAGVAITSFSLAATEKFKDKQGNPQEEVEWINCTVWNKQAEIIAQYCTKGSLLYVSGKLKTTKWNDNGVDKYKTEVVVRDFQFLTPKSDSQPQNAQQGGFQQPQQQQQNSGFGGGQQQQQNSGFDIPQHPEFVNNAQQQNFGTQNNNGQ